MERPHRLGAFFVVSLAALSMVPLAAAQESVVAAAFQAELIETGMPMVGRLVALEDVDAGVETSASKQGAPAPTNPFEARPKCASLFMKSDWQLGGKQKACDWIHNGVFSMNAMLGAAWSAGFSQRTDQESERGDGFATRFGRKFGQNAAKSTAAYLGRLIVHEDPRKVPPYLVMRTSPTPRGFFRRTGAALANNFVSFRCVNDCTKESDIRKVPALSRVLGSFASGFAGELLTYDRPNSTRHAMQGVASAYASTFVNALFVEFKPELSAFAGKAFTKIFGVR